MEDMERMTGAAAEEQPEAAEILSETVFEEAPEVIVVMEETAEEETVEEIIAEEEAAEAGELPDDDGQGSDDLREDAPEDGEDLSGDEEEASGYSGDALPDEDDLSADDVSTAEDAAEEAGDDDSAEKDDDASEAGSAARERTIVGVRFRTAGRVYYFDPLDMEMKRGDHVIVETARGVEYGLVIAPPMTVRENKIPKQLKPVIRVATEEDAVREAANRAKEKEAFRTCQQKIRSHGLEMKLIDAEYTFDNSKLLFYFTADGRVDFRELVKDLATVFRTRIELRQIGVRDETKILGGYGICGRPLCCHAYLSDFAPVSIKMAKEQNLSLNPTKISGMCGRLMCCLKNEEETYEELNRTLPKPGDEVEGNDGLTGEVENVDILRQRVKVLVEIGDEKELHEYGDGEWTLIRRRRRGAARHPKKDAAKQGGKDQKDAGQQQGRKEQREPRDRKDRPERGERPERTENAERQERADKDARGDRPEKETRGERRRGRGRDRGEQQGGRESSEQQRGERRERGEQRSERPERGEQRGERTERRDRDGQQGERQDRERRRSRRDRRDRRRDQESGQTPADPQQQAPEQDA